MSEPHSEYSRNFDLPFLQRQLEELRGGCLEIGDIGALYKQHEALRDASPSGCLRLCDLRAARRDGRAPGWGPGLTDREWASVLESIACADEEQPVDAELFVRIYYEVQLLRARDGNGCELKQEGISGTLSSRIGALLRTMVSYASHMNPYLANDPLFKDVLHIHREHLLDAIKDGVLFCKLINLAVPGTIDERAINNNTVLSMQDRLENVILCLTSSIAIGCNTCNIDIEDLAEGRSDPVLQMVSEIMKIQLLSDVNLQRTPELTALAEGDKDLEKLVTMPSEKILLRWINFILKKGGFDRRVSNFSSDLKDSEVYAYLLSVLAPECNVTSSVMPRVGWHRAEAVLKAAHLMGCNEFMTPQDIIDGLPDWNLAFLAHIFHTRNGLSNQGIQLPVVNEFSQEIQNGWEERFFRLWINSLGVSSRINSLFEDLKDGWVLLEVSDKIAPGYVDWSIANRQPIDQQSKMLENCNQVVNIAERLKLPLPKHFGKFIVSETKTMILKLLWGFQRHSIFDQLKNLGFHSDEMEIAQYDILAWANKTVEECSKNSKIESFEDKSLSSGTFFLSLLSAMGPQLVNWSHVTRGENEQEKKLNASYIISIARKLGCSIFLLPEDIVDVNPKMMLCLTASILSTHLLRSSSHLLENENGSSSSHANSNHICRDDTEFILKPVGKNIRKKLIIPREEYVDLLSYQKDAMGWFWKLYCEGTGGILADDMGLGKTRQVAVFIIGLFNSKLVERVLLVAPPTLLSQWETEFFNRGLTANIRRYYGEPNEKYDALHQIIKKGGVLLTTYDLIRSDYSQIRDGSTWDYMVIDEGHLIKNPKTKAFKALVQIPCNRRIVVTGTPIQNCAEELWTLFKFCHPNLLPSFNTFKKDYSSPLFMGNYKDSTNKEIILSSKAAEDLRKLTKPYVLRREKEVLVRSDAIEQAVLGNKTEIVVWLKMTPLQIKLYETQIKLYKLFRSETSELKKKAAINFVVARLLQKISNHPLQISKKDAEEEIEAETESGLIDEIGVVEEMGVIAEMVSRLQHLVQVDDSINASVSSCKLKFIVELLENLLGPHSEHRVLIFSQTRQMLDAIQGPRIKCTLKFFNGKRHNWSQYTKHAVQRDHSFTCKRY